MLQKLINFEKTKEKNLSFNNNYILNLSNFDFSEKEYIYIYTY